MAKRKNTSKTKSRGSNSAAFVIGSLFGGLVGGATALWKTPQSGEELRAKLTGALTTGGKNTSTLDFSTVPAESKSTVGDKAPGEATGEPTESGIGHVATTEELIRPPSAQI